MKEKVICIDCGKLLTKDEIALNKKLIDLNLTEFQCLNCLSQSLGCSVEDLEIKIAEFKEQGCTLFL